MLQKYTIEFETPFRRQALPYRHSTDDPVACVEFLEELMERRFRIKAILHEGVELPRADFDRTIKMAAEMLVAKTICAALGIPAEEEHFRFGFAA